MSAPAGSATMPDVRAGCAGVPPLTSRLERWVTELAAAPALLDELIEEHGSPLNLHQTEPFARNAAEIRDSGQGLGVEPGIFFARKANKCITFVEEAGRLGLGVDVAGQRELEQTLAAGIDPAKIVLTAAVKPEPLLELCIASGITVVVDNRDELALLRELSNGRLGCRLPIALRLTPGRLERSRPRSRFGLAAADALAAAREIAGAGQLQLAGLHFHLDGYAAADRSATIGEAIELADRISDEGAALRFIDIGGGFPISYLRDREEWEQFWSEQRQAVAGLREPLTFGGHGLGLRAEGNRVAGEPAVYPYWQRPTRGEWLRGILTSDTQVGGRTERVADALSRRRLQLRCEPGRALLDGCGATAARVEFTKPYEARTRLVGLAMNRTQCRTTSEDFLVDPLLVPGPGRERDRIESDPEADRLLDAYLVGAYCIERELLSWRRLRFEGGVSRGDIVLFPNTAGYFMHILESSSHQLPLARNLILAPRGSVGAQLDPIDLPTRQR